MHFLVLNKINLTQFPDILIRKLERVVEETFGASPDLVDLVKSGTHKSSARGEEQIEVVRLANAEGDKHNSDEDPKVLESAGAVCFHIVAHDLVAVNAEGEKYRRRNNSRAVLALGAMPKHRAAVLKKNVEKFAKSSKRGLG